jgi:HTH-type transcriptional regulator/antitoxin HigA
MAKTIQNEFHPDVVPPPGETIKDSLEALGMSQAELAKRMGASEKYVIDLLYGHAQLTADTALKLERVFNVPARFWTNLELGYRDFLARQAEKEKLTRSAAWARQFPLKEMAALRWIERAKDELTNTHRLLTFFGCASEEQWESVWQRADAVFRHSAAQQSEWPAVAAWLRRGEIEAREMDLPAYDVLRWEKALASIRRNITPDPKEFQSMMLKECMSAGVGLVFLPSLPKMAVSGACVWISQNPYIYLSLRYRTDDHLWFSFFHEACHVYQNIRKRLFVDEPRQAAGDPKEVEANRFAADTLLEPNAYSDFVRTKAFDAASVCAFARSQNLTPGIVVGRLQHDHHVPWATHLNTLKLHYTWAEEPPVA